MPSLVQNALAIILPKGKQPRGGVAATSSFNPQLAVQSQPAYREHLTDIFASRTASNSKTLLLELFRHDPDISAAVNAYLTIADTEPEFWAYDENGELSTDGILLANQIVEAITVPSDYSLKFQYKPGLGDLCSDLRYMLLLRGAVGAELIFNKLYQPSDIRNVDTSSLTWSEAAAGVYKPEQTVPGEAQRRSLDTPTFFFAKYRQSPTSMYSYSTFVSSVNSIAARQQVINDLYRIMQVTGYPRIDISVLEEVIKKSAPASLRDDANAYRSYVASEISAIKTAYAALRPEQAFIHTDATDVKIINDRNPGAGLQIAEVVATLDAQNVAALKVMAVVVGKGDGNSQVASTEARLFSMSADQLNQPLETLLSQMLTFAARIAGFAGKIKVVFPPAELRPATELEPMLTMKQSRLQNDLSLGVISDQEYSMEMYGRAPLASAPPLSGTGFLQAAGVSVDATKVSPNSDPLGRGLATPGGKSAKSNTVKNGPKSK